MVQSTPVSVPCKTVGADGFEPKKEAITLQKCVTYARFSSDRQSESSIEAQQSAMARYISERGLVLIGEYADRATTGTNDNRPEFRRMLSDLQTLHPDYVLVHKHDRFARNEYDTYIYKHHIEQAGAKLVAVAEDFGDHPLAAVMEGMMISMAAYYSRNLSAEVIKGRKVQLAHGAHLGGFYPLGYRKGNSEGTELTIDEVEAYFVRRLFECCVSGIPYRTVVEEMELAGVRGRAGAKLSSGSISKILHNPFYMGTYVGSAGGEHRTIDDHHPAIVSKELFEEAQRVMELRAYTGRGHGKKNYLCSGLAYCGSCGAPVRGSTTRYTHKDGSEAETVLYRCTARCGNLKAIPVAELDADVCDYVNSFLTGDLRAQIRKALADYIPQATEAAKRKRTRSVEADIRKLEKQVQNLIANMASGVLPAEVLTAMGAQISELNRRIDILRELDKPAPELSENVLDEFFQAEAHLSPDGDTLTQLKIVKRYVKRINVYSTEVEIISTLDDWIQEHHPELLASPAKKEHKTKPSRKKKSKSSESADPSAPSDQHPDSLTKINPCPA